MEEIKIGEYFRTQKGKIHKWSKGRTYIGQDKIVKHNQNIIYLVCKGDYVNGERVELIYLEGIKPYIKLSNRDKNNIFGGRIYNEDIKSIVTKEMFNQVKYEV